MFRLTFYFLLFVQVLSSLPIESPNFLTGKQISSENTETQVTKKLILSLFHGKNVLFTDKKQNVEIEDGVIVFLDEKGVIIEVEQSIN